VPRRDLTHSAVDDVRYIVGIYDKDAGPDNQRLYLNGARVAQMIDTLPIENQRSCPSASDGCERHRRSLHRPH
jgi:hypothetical protein